MHPRGDLGQLRADGQPLRAGRLALAARAAGVGTLGRLHVLPVIAQAARVGILRILVHHAEIARDIHAEGAGHAVAAGRAAHERARADLLAHRRDDLLLLL